MEWGWDLQSNCQPPAGKIALSLSEHWTVVARCQLLSKLSVMWLVVFVTDLPGYVGVSTSPEPFLWWKFCLAKAPTSQVAQQEQC